MAWLELDKRSGHFNVGFRIGEQSSRGHSRHSTPGGAFQTLNKLPPRFVECLEFCPIC